jgi:formylglycine-generating enzyme required for sulfatase activity/tRNA A-37 threonylcarbamoyl transferase component Bud32
VQIDLLVGITTRGMNISVYSLFTLMITAGSAQLSRMQVWQNNQEIKNGRFRIQKVLGAGGFGVTYLALEYIFESAISTLRERQVVIKTLNHIQQSRDDFAERQERFVNEAMILKGCQHPHIVQVYELIQEDGLWGMVMEYIEGEELAHYADECGQMPEAEALVYIDQISQAISYCHEQGFLHRDIKPHNILLRHKTKQVVLIDFGLAVANNNADNNNVTTAGYAPPEQYRTGESGPYSDVYALAATCYHLLTAQVPIPANFRSYVDMPAPQHFNHTVSDLINGAILSGMAQKPAERPQTVAEFRRLLGLDNESKLEEQRPPLHSYPEIDQDWQATIGGVTRFSEVEMSCKIVAPVLQKTIIRSGSFWQGKNIELDMVELEGGEFFMGSSEPGSLIRESPQHFVTITPFQISKFPITQEQYFAVLENNPAYFRGNRLPVENISWYDAMSFCAQLSERLGQVYRLPTEAEWEYACRARTSTPFSFGAQLYPNLANYDSSIKSNKFKASLIRRRTSFVDIFPANAFGLHDMHGNVWEWCGDYQHDDYMGAPSDGSAWRVDGDPSQCILRGGAWGCSPHVCRSTARHWAPTNYRSNKIGFRVVCDIK